MDSRNARFLKFYGRCCSEWTENRSRIFHGCHSTDWTVFDDRYLITRNVFHASNRRKHWFGTLKVAFFSQEALFFGSDVSEKKNSLIFLAQKNVWQSFARPALSFEWRKFYAKRKYTGTLSDDTVRLVVMRSNARLSLFLFTANIMQSVPQRQLL